jgi:hypothetical protein
VNTHSVLLGRPPGASENISVDIVRRVWGVVRGGAMAKKRLVGLKRFWASSTGIRGLICGLRARPEIFGS